jgi:hypothetical protein
VVDVERIFDSSITRAADALQREHGASPSPEDIALFVAARLIEHIRLRAEGLLGKEPS